MNSQQPPLTLYDGISLTLKTFHNNPSWAAGRFPIPVQEFMLMEDIFYLLLGIPSCRLLKLFTSPPPSQSPNNYQKQHQDAAINYTYEVDETINATLVDSIKPMLLIAGCYSKLESFVERNITSGNGRILQSFCSVLSVQLQEFREQVVSLEQRFQSGTLGLQQLSLDLQSHSRRLSVICCFVHQTTLMGANGSRGGSIIRRLEGVILSHRGDQSMVSMLDSLLQGSIKPFFKALSLWICSGQLPDGNGVDFFIRERSSLDPISLESDTTKSSSSSSILSPFILLEDCVPLLLESSGLVMKIIQTGAYQRIFLGLKHSSASQAPAEVKEAPFFKWDHRVILSIVDGRLGEVNSRLMHSLLKDNCLATNLRRCKRFFLGQNGDIQSSFLDLLSSKPGKHHTWDQVEAAWDEAVRGCPLPVDDLNLVSCYRSSLSLSDQLNMISGGAGNLGVVSAPKHREFLDLFSLKIKFSFPESLIFSPESLSKYELIFRLRLRLLSISKGLERMSLKSGLKRQMLNAIGAIQQYLIFEVCEPLWDSLLESLTNASSLDVIMSLHCKFLDSCLRQAMLTNGKLMNLLTTILDLCSTYTNAPLSVGEDQWSSAMKTFLEGLQYHSSKDYDYYLGSLFSRLDMNGFYYSSNYGKSFGSSGGGGMAAMTS